MEPKPKWYAIWTRSRHEWVASQEIKNKGFHVFFPQVERLSKRKDRKKTIQVPLFPGYLFVHTVLTPEHYLRIVRSQGVVQILGYAKGKAQVIPDYEINSIKILLQNQLPLEPHQYIPAGTLVKVISGPLKGVVGIVIAHRGKKTLVVQVDLFKQAVACTLPVDSIFPLETKPLYLPGIKKKKISS